MPRELTGSEIQATWESYLTREIDQHKRDIISNQGKVTEIEELLRRVQNTCLYCGEYVYNYTDEDRMGEHVKAKHQEPEPELTKS